MSLCCDGSLLFLGAKLVAATTTTFVALAPLLEGEIVKSYGQGACNHQVPLIAEATAGNNGPIHVDGGYLVIIGFGFWCLVFRTLLLPRDQSLFQRCPLSVFDPRTIFLVPPTTIEFHSADRHFE